MEWPQDLGHARLVISRCATHAKILSSPFAYDQNLGLWSKAAAWKLAYAEAVLSLYIPDAWYAKL